MYNYISHGTTYASQLFWQLKLEKFGKLKSFLKIKKNKKNKTTMISFFNLT